jgi:hypothetical protein
MSNAVMNSTKQWEMSNAVMHSTKVAGLGRISITVCKLTADSTSISYVLDWGLLSELKYLQYHQYGKWQINRQSQ